MCKIDLIVLAFMTSFTTTALAKTEAKKMQDVTIAARAYCGDGILNGNEECDGNDFNFTDCSHLNGGEGKLSCQPSCVYDISGCNIKAGMIKEVNYRIGGLAESCSCDCDTQICAGGCIEGSEDLDQCLFGCRPECVCKCEGNLNAQIESCNVDCLAFTSISGHPQVECSLSQCKLITSISPNIGGRLFP